jgi:hypothetical protein
MRKFTTSSVLEFNSQLTYESWNNVFAYDDVNLSFNNIFNIYLRLFQSSFLLKKKNYNRLHNKPWLIQGIKISCINKKGLFVICRNSNDPIHINYYKKYSRILTDLINLAKKNSTTKNF